MQRFTHDPDRSGDTVGTDAGSCPETISIFATAVRFLELTPAEERQHRQRLLRQQVREARRAERELYWDEPAP